MPSHPNFIVLVCILLTGVACSKVPNTGDAQPNAVLSSALLRPSESSLHESLSPLFAHIWRVTKAPSPPAAGSIYIFLASGTLLETSCVETYRIAIWTADKGSPRKLRVVEDRQPVFSANITELTDTTVRLQQHLTRTKETRDLTLSAVDQEFVCPDLPK